MGTYHRENGEGLLGGTLSLFKILKGNITNLTNFPTWYKEYVMGMIIRVPPSQRYHHLTLGSSEQKWNDMVEIPL